MSATFFDDTAASRLLLGGDGLTSSSGHDWRPAAGKAARRDVVEVIR